MQDREGKTHKHTVRSPLQKRLEVIEAAELIEDGRPVRVGALQGLLDLLRVLPGRCIPEVRDRNSGREDAAPHCAVLFQ